MKIIIDEIRKSPLTAIGILVSIFTSIIALIIALTGSPFQEGTLLNPFKPNISFALIYTTSNDTNMQGHFKTEISIRNNGKSDTILNGIEINLFDKEMEQIQLIEPSSFPQISLISEGNESFMGTADKEPYFVAICIDLLDEDGQFLHHILKIASRISKEDETFVRYSHPTKQIIKEIKEKIPCKK